MYLDAKVVAVGGSDKSRADAFASKYGLLALESYEAVASHPEVDLIYICTLHPRHLDSVKAAISSKKPILCEKPLAHNARDTRAILQLAGDSGVFFMEAMWSRYFPALQRIRKEVKEGRIGRILSFDAKLGYSPDPALVRNATAVHGASALLDVGIYPISMASFLLGPEKPSRVSSIAVLRNEYVFPN